MSAYRFPVTEEPAPSDLRRLVADVGNLARGARVPVADLAGVFLVELSLMLCFAARNECPEELAKLRRMVGEFSASCAGLIGTTPASRRDYH